MSTADRSCTKPRTMPETQMGLGARNAALLVVDMQNDFLDPRGYFADQGMDVSPLRKTIAPIRSLREALPPAVKVVFTTQVYEPDGSDDLWRVHRIRPARLVRCREGGPVRRGTWGAQIVPELTTPSPERVIEKRRFDGFYQTDLELALRCWGVKTLILAGVVTDVCIETTLRSAYVRDFDVVLVRDCTAAWGAEDAARTMATVESHFGLVMTSGDVLDALRHSVEK